jgi:triosephosphate isomerase
LADGVLFSSSFGRAKEDKKQFKNPRVYAQSSNDRLSPMKRTPFIAANWKMNSPPQNWDGKDSPYRQSKIVDVVVFPGFLDIDRCKNASLTIGAQYGRPEESGPFTGDISMTQIAEHGCEFVLCGHSERRKYHAENNAFIAVEMEAALKAGLVPILCIGETAEERAAGKAKDVVKSQLQSVSDDTFIVSYEPVWAIGTGKNASADDAEDMQAFIRSLLPKNIQSTTRILYGGSVKPESASEYLKQPDIDGLLVGACSLDPAAFQKIVECAAK